MRFLFDERLRLSVRPVSTFSWGHYNILFENGIEWSIVSMSEVDTSTLDGKCITALLMGAIRADRFSEGALLYFFETGTITKWLNRLKEIDEKKSLD